MADTPNPELTPAGTETTPQTATGGVDDASAWITAGSILGDRYEIRSLLGHGGMGEVWQASDLKLRVEVALKSLRPEFINSERRRELLRTEVRTAREVLSPNVCRVYDLVVEDGHELLSMEYVDGITLLQFLKDRGPLDLRQASELAAQFLAGLGAVHEAGLVHRDFKPENVMITRAGRVLVMDFGIAKSVEAETGTIIGTPAYMAPEQLRGGAVDARTDVFAAGVVLAEMISEGGIKERKTRENVWKGVREDPPRLPDSPWEPVLRKAVAADPRDRFPSARALLRALEEVTLRVAGSEDKHPYPGLAAFTEADADHFFGRESEVEALCSKLGRPRLLAIVGPSGAGKSSLLGAGLIPALPEGWGHIRCSPGDRPSSAVARALLPELSGDSKALEKILDFDDPDIAVELLTTWRKRHSQAILVLDQFEELFTLNTPEEQMRFAELLGRLPIEANVHVLLSMRDDFFFHCSGFPALAPIVSELTLIGAPQGGSLRRALVQPALISGFRFEDEALVDDMIAEVSDERGALPLLAFAAARLWEKRDRESGLLTREAYEEIGGVGGALAQHADATLDKIGMAREPTVREVFRNLVTGQGTRAIRDRDELLSVFEDRDDAEQVLQALIDARLITSFEVPGSASESEPSHRVEIIHESLLAAWPRLVRWQTQDADGAQLRDQLRQVAKMWEDRGQPSDLLWTGPSYREFEAWRERYAGGLSGTEEAFAQAMVHRAGEQRRRRTLLVSSAFAVLFVGMATLTYFWRAAVDEALRAEASRILSLATLELEDYPTGAFAYSLKSLETYDNEEARRFVLRVLQSGPIARVAPLDIGAGYWLEVSPRGDWVAVGGFGNVERNVQIVHRDGSSRRLLADDWGVGFTPDGERLYTHGSRVTQFWSLPELEEVTRLEFEGDTLLLAQGEQLVSFTSTGTSGRGIKRWAYEDDAPREVEELTGVRGGWSRRFTLGPRAQRVAFARGSELFVQDLAAGERPRLVGRHPVDLYDQGGIAFHPSDPVIVSQDMGGEVRFWNVDPEPGQRPIRTLKQTRHGKSIFSPDGRRLLSRASDVIRIWDLDAPEAAAPVVMRRATHSNPGIGFLPAGNWVAAADVDALTLWPVGRRYPMVLSGLLLQNNADLAFSADGASVITGDATGVRIWPLSGTDGKDVRLLMELGYRSLAVDPLGRFVLVWDRHPEGGLKGALVPLDGGRPRPLPDGPPRGDYGRVAVSPDGRQVAATQFEGSADSKTIRVWSLESMEMIALGPVAGAGAGFVGGFQEIAFVDHNQLLSLSPDGLRSWDLTTARSELILEGDDWGFSSEFAVDRTGRRVVVKAARGRSDLEAGLLLIDLDSRETRSLTRFGSAISSVEFSPDGSSLAVGTPDGLVQVARLDASDTPHLLFGHDGTVSGIAFSPDGGRVASVAGDGTIRVWSTLEGEPLHALPYEQLLAKLRAITNVRAVMDPAAPGGYRHGLDPFPGWAELPDW